MKNLCSFMLAAVLIPGALFAAEPEGRVITLPGAVSAVKAGNPSLLAARRQLGLLEAEVTVNSAYPNPSLELEKSMSGGNGYELKALQPVPLNRRAGTAKAAAAASPDAAKKDVEALETRLLRATRGAWYALRIARERSNFEETNLKFSMDILNKIEMRLQTGEAGNADLARAKVEAARSKLHLQEAGALAGAAAGELNSLMGRRPDAPLETAMSGGFDLTPAPAGPEPLEKYTAMALSRRAEFGALALNTRAAALTADLEKSRRLPVPELGLIHGSESGSGYSKLFLGLELPLWYNNKGELKRALAQQAVLGYEADRLELEIRREVYDAWLELGLAQKRLASARETVFLLNDLRRSASQDYLSGKIDLTGYYETNSVFLEENINYLDALQEYYEKTAQMDAAVNSGEAK